MLPKAPLDSRMSDFSWVTTPLWLPESLRPFLYNSLYSWHLFLIFSASGMSLPFLSFIAPVFAWNVPLISPVFLKTSPVFPILLFSSTSLHCSLKKDLSLFPILWTLHSVGYLFPFLSCFSLLAFPQLFVKPPQSTTLPFIISVYKNTAPWLTGKHQKNEVFSSSVVLLKTAF